MVRQRVNPRNTPLVSRQTPIAVVLISLLIPALADADTLNDALFKAVSKGDNATAQAALAAGADVNAKNILGHTPLTLAASKRHSSTVKVLLAAGADVNAKGFSGETALMHYARALPNEYPVTLYFLVRAGRVLRIFRMVAKYPCRLLSNPGGGVGESDAAST